MSHAGKTTQRLPRMLVVDDEVAQCQALEMLFSNDFEVVTATSVAKANELALDTFDVAIVDWHLPNEDGLGLAAKLSEFIPKGRVWLFTADPQIDAYSEDQGWWYIPKHYEPEQLMHCVMSNMKRSQKAHA